MLSNGSNTNTISKKLNLDPQVVIDVKTEYKIHSWSAVFQELYDEGLTDNNIAIKCHVEKYFVQEWRRRMGYKSMSKITQLDKHNERMKLYERGYKDEEIAEALHSTKKAICSWRVHNNLPNNKTKNIIPQTDLDKYINERRVDRDLRKMLRAAPLLRENESEIPQQKDNYQKSFALPLKDKDSLFCDTEFLEQLFGKQLKNDECK